MADGQEPELDEELEEAGADGPAPPEADADPKFRQLLEKLYAEHHFDFRQYKEASLVRRVQSDGICWLSGTTWHGVAAMRISVSNWSTSEEDVAMSIEAILSAYRAASL